MQAEHATVLIPLKKQGGIMFLYRFLLVDKSPYLYATLAAFVLFVAIAVLQLARGQNQARFRLLLICSVVSIFTLFAGINDGFMNALNSLANVPASVRIPILSSYAASILAGLQTGFVIIGLEMCLFIVLWAAKPQCPRTPKEAQ
jgi:hypothetical protein